MADLEMATRAMRHHEDALLMHENVVHIAVIETGKRTCAIEIGLKQEEDHASVALLPALPDALPVPDEAGNLKGSHHKVDVVRRVVGEARKFDTPAYPDKMRPAKGGVSCGNPLAYPHPDAGTGTFGGLLTINDSPYLVSSHHVIYGTQGQDGEDVIQQGPKDGGKVPANAVAQNTYGVDNELVDVGFAAIVGEVGELVTDGTVCFGKFDGIGEAKQFDEIKKCGRTTGKSIGTVQSIFATIKIGEITYRDQLLLDLVATHGDSGSFILDTENKIVGLLMAGTNGGQVYANKIANVMAEGTGHLPKPVTS